jgi:mRNA-degrading endonuclease RelE of RelBE toxin-antitoxin system
MSSKIKILTTEKFDKAIKKLFKKYSSLIEDLEVLKNQITENPTSGNALGNNCYKVRMKITSKQQGKSSGARVITYVLIEESIITLLDIYDKSEKDSITDKELKVLIKKVGS